MNFFKNLTVNTGVVLALGAIVFCGTQTESVTMAEREAVKASPTYQSQFCEAAPVGVLPTGVMLQRIGGGTHITSNTAAIDRALDVALDGAKWNGVRVLQFCK